MVRGSASHDGIWNIRSDLIRSFRVNGQRARGRNGSADYREWSVDGSESTDGTGYSYRSTFRSLLRGREISDIVSSARREYNLERILALDFMGYGYELSRLPIDRGLAVALGRPPKSKSGELYSEGKVDLLRGDVLRRSTWKSIEEWLETQGSVNGFNLILSRPVRALRVLPQNCDTHMTLLNRAWRLLSNRGGILLTQVSAQVLDHERRISFQEDYSALIKRVFPVLEDWISRLNLLPGVEAYCNKPKVGKWEGYDDLRMPVISLTKTEGAPEVLVF